MIEGAAISLDKEDSMKKLSLDVDKLKVETFATARVDLAEGTVLAHAAPSYPDPVYTCAYHCTWIGTTCQ